MKFFRAVASVIVPIASASMLAACGVPQASVNPMSVPAESLAARPANSGDLIYAAHNQYVEVYTFPAGTYQTMFTEKGSANGMCADSSGNVFIVADVSSSKSATGYIYEYAHGATAPAATLDAPANDLPMACSVDPTTGDLAVTLQNFRDFEPSVAIYAKASGTPKIYHTDELGANPQAAYDDSGNLLATSGGNVAVELAKGKTTFTGIKLTELLGGVRHVQWDGKYFALESFNASKHIHEKLFERIYRVQLSGSKGEIVGGIAFDGWPQGDPGQSWIAGTTIVGTPYNEIAFWPYPGGGKATKTFHPQHPVKAITVSVAGH